MIAPPLQTAIEMDCIKSMIAESVERRLPAVASCRKYREVLRARDRPRLHHRCAALAGAMSVPARPPEGY
jgi:hypothetical protein